MEEVAAAYDILVENVGQEEADAIICHAAYNYIITMLNLEMFDNPYTSSAYADSITYSDSAKAYGLETQRQSVVMLKNDGTISADGADADKPTVYVPYVYNTGYSVAWMGGISEGKASWAPSMDLDILGEYFEIVTDTLGEASGEDGAYLPEDLTRAEPDAIAACDYVLVGMSNPYNVSKDSDYAGVREFADLWASGAILDDDDTWYPANLQYAEYTADTARDPSIAGLVLADGSRQNRSYKGNTSPAVANYGDLEALEYAAEAAGDVPVIVSMRMERGMVWTEVEPLADVILVCYQAQKPQVVAEIILGETEPNGLLVFQQPASMEAVEAQLEDVPRDMECYATSTTSPSV